MKEELRVLRTDEEIDELIAYLKDPEKQAVAYDTETTGLSLSAEVVGVSVAAEEHLGFYIINAEWRFEKKTTQVPCEACAGTGQVKKKKQTVVCETCEGLRETTKTEFLNGHIYRYPNKEKTKELLRLLLEKNLITHNGTVDFQWTLRNFGVDLRPASAFDTMPAAHLLDENRRVGLKELGYTIFGEDAKKEAEEMKASVLANGGVWEQTWNAKKKKWVDKRGGNKEMFKASPNILGKYGAKDAILTLKLFYKFAADMAERKLDDFFYEETMPLFRGPIYDLNTTGLKCDVEGLRKLQKDLEDECAMLKVQIETDIAPYTKERFPNGFGKAKGQFNIGSKDQLAWLLFIKLKNDWKKLTDAGRDCAKNLIGKAPYNPSGRRAFERAIADATDMKGRPLKLEKYLATNKTVLSTFIYKYKWVELLLQYKKADKLLNTYAVGIQNKLEYGVVHPGFLQCSTTGNRLSSRGPNFQQLPREDKRIKENIIARPGKVFVGSDFEQVEPRVFASISGDKRLLACFASGQDVYSVVGISTFRKFDCTPYKSGPGSFGEKYPLLRQVAKEIMLSATYGITAFKLCDVLNTKAPRKEGPWTVDEVQEVIDAYFEAYPDVKKLQLKFHQHAIDHGVVYNMFGRPRHIPMARMIRNFGKNVKAEDLSYEYRTLLNNAVNFPIQGTAGSILNRSLIRAYRKFRELEAEDPAWAEVRIIGSVHDEIWLEGPEHLGAKMVDVLRDSMENSVHLPGVKLKAEPKVARNLAELK